MMRFMQYYMYEGKPHTLQDLRKVLQSKLSGYYSRKNELYKQQHPEKFVKKQNSEEQATSAT